MTLQQHDRGVCKKITYEFSAKKNFLVKLFSLYFFRKNKILFKKNFDRVKSPPFYYRGGRLNQDSFNICLCSWWGSIFFGDYVVSEIGSCGLEWNRQDVRGGRVLWRTWWGRAVSSEIRSLFTVLVKSSVSPILVYLWRPRCCRFFCVCGVLGVVGFSVFVVFLVLLVFCMHGVLGVGGFAGV